MAFLIKDNLAKIQSGTKQYAVVQPDTTQFTSLYGVEVSVKNGFTSAPDIDIYVFNNPNAAIEFIRDKVDSGLTEEEAALRGIRYDSKFQLNGVSPCQYLITAEKAHWHDGCLPETPAGIPGCTYEHDPKPFKTHISAFGFDSTPFLTVVAVFNSEVSDTQAFVRTICSC